MGRCPCSHLLPSREARGPSLSLVLLGRCLSVEALLRTAPASAKVDPSSFGLLGFWGGRHVRFGEVGGGGCGLILDKNPPAVSLIGVQSKWNACVCWGGGSQNYEKWLSFPKGSAEVVAALPEQDRLWPRSLERPDWVMVEQGMPVGIGSQFTKGELPWEAKSAWRAHSEAVALASKVGQEGTLELP